MNLYEKIVAIYPELNEFDFIERILLQDDSNGKGPYIARWTHPTLARPTQEQLDSVEEE